MIFVTLGSQKFQFDRLLEKLDELVEAGIICDDIMAQVGASTYIPKHYRYVDFMDREEFADTMNKCSVVITHGGTGVIVGAVKKGKKVIAVPRLKKYGEHVDDHQLQLLKQFDELDIICACYDMDMLGECYKNLDTMEFRPYQSNTHVIINSIDDYIQQWNNKRGKKDA